MNRENVEYCIELMKQAKNLDMRSWQHPATQEVGISSSVEELHECGNTACFAGYVALSEKFQADGGSLSPSGAPIYNDSPSTSARATSAIAAWLGISRDVAHKLIHGVRSNGLSYDRCSFYQKLWPYVAPDDVIEKLQLILDGKLS